MKFEFGYKTKDNETRYGIISASSRDAAYKNLKERGIRPFSVKLAPGILNRLASFGKRTYVIIALATVSLVSCLIISSQSKTIEAITLAGHSPLPRHQIYGDPALMSEFERTEYANVFAHPGERLLASFAQPGVLADPVFRKGIDASILCGCLTNDVIVLESDAREVNELKRIVMSMKLELERYLSNGIGTPERYLLRLRERQKREAQIYINAKRDSEKTDDRAERERINASLRAIGLRTITQKIDEEPQKE